MSDSDDWLMARAPGYPALSADEKKAIADFTLLWSLFEARLLKERGSPDALHEAVERLVAAKLLTPADGLATALTHFRERYWCDDGLTPPFKGLRVSPRHVDSVAAVLSGAERGDEQITIALLLIVHRLRNNLFHGPKWAYGIADQRGNFENANRVLIAVMDLHRPLDP